VVPSLPLAHSRSLAHAASLCGGEAPYCLSEVLTCGCGEAIIARCPTVR
jgi:hypothetical protein